MIVFNKKICIVLTSLFLLFLCMSTVCSTVIHHPIYTGLMDEEYNYTDDLIVYNETCCNNLTLIQRHNSLLLNSVHNETCCNLTPGYAIRNFTPEPITDIDEQFYRCGADDYPFTPILIEGFPIKQVNSTQKLHESDNISTNNNTNCDIHELNNKKQKEINTINTIHELNNEKQKKINTANTIPGINNNTQKEINSTNNCTNNNTKEPGFWGNLLYNMLNPFERILIGFIF